MIYAVGESKEEAIQDFVDELEFVWRNYVLADDSELTQDAIELKHRVQKILGGRRVDDNMKAKTEENMENIALWTALQKQNPNVPLLREAVDELCRLLTQKTAGQRKNKPQDIPFESLPRIKMTILCEATALVLSGVLDKLECADE